MADESKETLTPEETTGSSSHDSGITDFRRPMIEAARTGAAQAAVHPAASPAHGDMHVDFLSDTTTIMGRTISVQGGIYTVVFGVLAVATLAEVLIGSLPFGVLLIPLLLGIATVKAGLVVAYYMHLRVDPRIFMYILIIPLVLVTLATLYLLSVPPTGY